MRPIFVKRDVRKFPLELKGDLIQKRHTSARGVTCVKRDLQMRSIFVKRDVRNMIQNRHTSARNVTCVKRNVQTRLV